MRDEYGVQVQDAIEALEQDGRTTQKSLDFLQGYRDLMHDYALVIYSGRSVSKMLNGSNRSTDENIKTYARDDIDLDTAKEYWRTPGPWYEDYPYMNDWNDVVVLLLQHVNDIPNPQELIDVYPDMPQETQEWLSQLVEQQAAEAVFRGDVTSTDVAQRTGTGHRIRIANTRQRQIQSVNCNVLAELPVAEEYLTNLGDPFISYDTVGDGRFGLSLGVIEGTLDALAWDEGEELELEGQSLAAASDSFLREYIEQFVKSTTSTWDVKAFEGKWYAIQDAQGVLHVVDCNPTLDPTVFVTYHKEGSEDPEPLLLNFVESSDGVYTLDSLSFVGEESGIRPVPVSELKTELSLMSSTIVESFIDRYYVPISQSEFVLTADNASSIKLVYTDVANISDIGDTTGDGKGLTEQYVVKDMYDDEIDITAQVEDAADGSKYDIRVADIQRATFNGHEQTPVLMHDGKALVEGEDYDVTYANNVEVGTATITFVGKGNFEGELSVTFQIKAAATPGEPEGNTPAQPADAKTTPTKKKLPQTGDTAAPWEALAATGAASITAALLVRRRRAE